MDLRVRSLDTLVYSGQSYLISTLYSGGSARVYRVDQGTTPTEVTMPFAPFTVSGAISVDIGEGIQQIPLDQLGWAAESPSADNALVSRRIVVGAQQDGLEVLTVPDTGGMRLYLGASGLDGISSYLISSSGTTSAGTVQASGGPGLASSISTMATFTFNNVDYLAAASTTDSGVSVFRRLQGGTMDFSDRLGAADGIGMNTPTKIQPIQINDQLFLVTAALGGTVTVLRLDADGSLNLVDHVLDGLETRFDSATAMETFEHDGQHFLIVGGGDLGLSLLQLLPTGKLLHHASLADSATTVLDNISDLVVTTIGASIFVFISSDADNGITQLEIDTSTLAALLLATAGTPLIGTGADEILIGGAGSDRLEGAAGNDILYDGAGNDVLLGGAGADVFAFSKDGQLDRIEDFNPAEDRLDLSDWGMIYAMSAVTIQPLTGGARLTFGTETLEVLSSSGQALTAQVMNGALVTALQRPVTNLIDVNAQPTPVTLSAPNQGALLEASTPALTLIGGSGFDIADYSLGAAGITANLHAPATNTGSAGGDLYTSIEGLRGTRFDDVLVGDTLANLLFGEEGNDHLSGGPGSDTLDGGIGNDWLFDPLGPTRFIGGQGDDTAIALQGVGIFEEADLPDTGSSTLNDIFAGGYGNDVISGGAGRDLLIGDYGASFYFGSDTLTGGTGDDYLQGGFGADVFVFRRGDGHDIIGQYTTSAAFSRAVDDLIPVAADFEPGVDRIRLEGFPDATDGATALALIYRNTAGFAEFNLDGTMVTFWGIDPSQLSANDFLI
ncbi:calcium-binding protein [Pseudogemmobacter sp. W21_MBD1_M6]|uniref:calcium-binding protein n=1 Tax=Pseudogemmobacter sp. W21_MBD1_M6 TaxID=3240271 RepID=UPI003F956D0F